MSGFKPPDPNVLKRYAKFLERFDRSVARQWGNLCNNDLEAASCEAYAWGLISDLNVKVKPNGVTNSHGMSVDFQCEKDTEKFYAEVTCIKLETMTTTTSLTHDLPPPYTVETYTLPTRAIWRECRAKARQCSDWDSPVLLIVGTFHFQDSRFFAPDGPTTNSLLAGEASFSWDVNPSTGSPLSDIYLTTSGSHAAFVSAEMELARKSISAILLAGFGISPPQYCGVLHPDAVRPFDPALLDQVQFGQVRIDRDTSQVSVIW